MVSLFVGLGLYVIPHIFNSLLHFALRYHNLKGFAVVLSKQILYLYENPIYVGENLDLILQGYTVV